MEITHAILVNSIGLFFGKSYIYIIKKDGVLTSKEHTMEPKHFLEYLSVSNAVKFSEDYEEISADTSFGADLIANRLLS